MLHGIVSLDGGPPPKYGCRDEIELGATAIRLDGECIGRDGSRSSSGGGDVIGVGQLLSKADADGLVYDSISIGATPVCRWHTVERPTCSTGQCRSCEIQVQLSGMLPRGGGSFGGFAPDPPPVVSQSCEPCPTDHNQELIPRLAAILRDRPFVTTYDAAGALRFYRSKAGCEGN